MRGPAVEICCQVSSAERYAAKMRADLLKLFAAALFAAGSAPVFAQSAASEHDSHRAASPVASALEMTTGEVRKIDRENGKVTLKHGEIRNLGMPPMTMAFRVVDPALLDKLNTGDKVRFRAERMQGALTVTAIEPAN